LTDAFDADVLIFAASPGHALGRRVGDLFTPRITAPDAVIGVGSLLLLGETLPKPMRTGDDREVSALIGLLDGLDLLPVDRPTADLAVVLGADYGLSAIDAIHLATAVQAGADRFITNNRRDFPTSITEIDVTYPESLPEPA
jgi:predicted nucleic acid-binding protein